MSHSPHIIIFFRHNDSVTAFIDRFHYQLRVIFYHLIALFSRSFRLDSKVGYIKDLPSSKTELKKLDRKKFATPPP